MKHQKFTLMLAVFALLVASALAQAQSRATVSIGFKFMAGSTAMPAGKYNLEQQSTATILIRDATGKVSAELPILTVLGRHDNDPFPELVFDSLSDGPHLSEVWFPGIDEGFLVLANKGAHKHQVLQAK